MCYILYKLYKSASKLRDPSVTIKRAKYIFWKSTIGKRVFCICIAKYIKEKWWCLCKTLNIQIYSPFGKIIHSRVSTPFWTLYLQICTEFCEWPFYKHTITSTRTRSSHPARGCSWPHEVEDEGGAEKGREEGAKGAVDRVEEVGGCK